jgi:DNA-binding NarL/FixJ family response regulator
MDIKTYNMELGEECMKILRGEHKGLVFFPPGRHASRVKRGADNRVKAYAMHKKGFKNQEIADELGLKKETIRGYIKIMKKRK